MADFDNVYVNGTSQAAPAPSPITTKGAMAEPPMRAAELAEAIVAADPAELRQAIALLPDARVNTIQRYSLAESMQRIVTAWSTSIAFSKKIGDAARDSARSSKRTAASSDTR